ncbi:MAG: hypothetical protein ACKO91_00255 [Acidimicrobiales bacterium]
MGLVVLGVVTVVLVALEPDRAHRARRLQRIGVGIGAIASALIALFFVAETVADSGGWAAAGLIAAWAVPVAVVGTLAWLRPASALGVLATVVAGVVALDVWYLADPEGWARFEDGVGPVCALAAFATTAALTVAGARRSQPAGALLLVLGSVPPVLVGAEGGVGGSLAVVGVVAVVTGACLVGSAVLDRSGTARTILS